MCVILLEGADVDQFGLSTAVGPEDVQWSRSPVDPLLLGYKVFIGAARLGRFPEANLCDPALVEFKDLHRDGVEFGSPTGFGIGKLFDIAVQVFSVFAYHAFVEQGDDGLKSSLGIFDQAGLQKFLTELDALGVGFDFLDGIDQRSPVQQQQ